MDNKNFINQDLTKPSSLNIDKGNAIIAYNKYKGFTLPLVVIAVSVLLLIFVVIPGINQYFASLKQLNEETQKLETLKNNYNFLTSIDQDEEDRNIKILTKALPSDKDYFGIITGVTTAASISSASIINYKFIVGDLSKLDDGVSKNPIIKMKITLSCSGRNLNAFINNLYKTAPLVEVSNIKFNDEEAELELGFYFKPFPPQNISGRDPVIKLSKSDQELLSEVTTWNNVLDQDQGVIQQFGVGASLSAGLLFNSSNSAQANPSPFD